MPEGDTIHRTAAALRTALVGKVITRFDAPRLVGPQPEAGRLIERVESHGKHLEVVWDDGLTLHTHMRMSGSWHLYRPAERWRKPTTQARVVLAVDDWVAVCFNAPVVEMYRQFDRHRHPGFGRLGPDLCRAEADLGECVRRLANYANPDATIADVLLDQRVACGVGNVFRSEVLWACEIHPNAPVASLDDTDRVQVINAAARMLRANLVHAARITTSNTNSGLAVYGRNGQRCTRCGDTVQVRRSGEHARLLYWCDGCQTHLSPRRAVVVEDRPMDPHPAAAKFLAELPWRRQDIAV
jgi:endonuclease VIII